MGRYPSERHDASPWSASDKSRACLAGDLGARGVLCQVRGDWSWYKQIFDFPSWSGKEICWRCCANKGPDDEAPFTDASASAKMAIAAPD